MIHPLTILGSTGSIGTQTLDLVRRNPGRFSVEALSAHGNASLIVEQIREFQPKFVAITKDEVGKEVQGALNGCPTKLFVGREALVQLLHAVESEIVVVAVLGFAALEPVLEALRLGKKLALANKESIVAGGDLVRKTGKLSQIVPVDSEHSSIFQLLRNLRPESVAKLYLTASGGPFLRHSKEELRTVTAAQAVKHPRWNMGAKISVDSATLMNKGLEVIEAAQLFERPIDDVRVLVHPESLVHGLVELRDGAVLSCLFTTDMRMPIAYALDALSGQERVSSTGVSALNLAQTLHFEEPDIERFPALSLAYEAGRIGGTAPTVLNGANEVAVQSFLDGRLSFSRIADVVRESLERHSREDVVSLEQVLEVDAQARAFADGFVKALA